MLGLTRIEMRLRLATDALVGVLLFFSLAFVEDDYATTNVDLRVGTTILWKEEECQ